MLTSIAGKSVVVTGGSKGIGKGIARVFARNGAKVTILARHRVEANAAAKDLGGDASAAIAAVTNLGELEEMAKSVAQRNGGIDVLCANAGIFPAAKLAEMEPETWDEVLATNLKGMFLSIKACLPAMKQKKKGRIVITSSITGPITGLPGWTAYGASKAGQLGFLHTAAIELAPHSITINAVMPGNVMTEGLEGLGAEYLEKMAASVPLRKLGTVEDIAHAALFFASDEAAYITGQTLVIDGGQVLPESLTAIEEMGG